MSLVGYGSSDEEQEATKPSSTSGSTQAKESTQTKEHTKKKELPRLSSWITENSETQEKEDAKEHKETDIEHKNQSTKEKKYNFERYGGLK